MLTIIATVSLVLAVLCSLWLLIDVIRHPQHMAIMNVVWPLTALYAGPLAILIYYWFGRMSMHDMPHEDHTNHSQHEMHGEHQMHGHSEQHADTMPSMPKKPFWQSVVVGGTHCGSGCTVGDIIAEGGMHFLVPTVINLSGASLVWFAWGVDYVLALLFGVAFQYFSIVPMRHLGFKEGLVTAFKVDSLSLTFWQIGMYGWMGLCLFGIFGLESAEMAKTSPIFWFMMQIAMLCGFVTSFPVNWWLIRTGIKETM
ncbi:DUF4396 domain-containing protein [Gimesia fumaroli]|uniref:DUF4396 domain-containing protein n=1 Tax=Gimesia fumaroli TaxID=2527976 RepID=A0A518IIJ2_9PLAN|nr:DUF4396 domain-containing protein [Gimesia fumaroli]QDV52913.1 hypothetical protein Enr17x_49830 [Gimesia fumaroli]